MWEAEHGIVPVQIRPDLTVRIQGLPHDLTQAEADKIARVVLALCGGPLTSPCLEAITIDKGGRIVDGTNSAVAGEGER
jgi:hypothetical protein